MAGHSHWAGIKHKKAIVDQKRGKLFSKLAKQIITTTRDGGKDPDTNLALRAAIDAAKSVSMPKDNIARAIARGSGEVDGAAIETVRYEGYGPGGVAAMVDALTDNRNRTTPHIRKIFGDHGGELGATGCVSWGFDMKGLILLELGERTEDEVFDVAVEAGAEDFQPAGDVYELSCDPKDFLTVRGALEEAGIGYESAEVTMVPKTYVDLNVRDGHKVLKMMEELEDDEDVTNVYANFNLPEELMAELEGE